MCKLRFIICGLLFTALTTLVGAFVLPRGWTPHRRASFVYDGMGVELAAGSSMRPISRSFTTRLHMFFKSPPSQDSRSKARDPLFSKENALVLPYEIQTTAGEGAEEVLLLEQASTDRHVESIVEINLRQYGSGPAVFPWDNPKLWIPYWDRQTLAVLIALSTRSKFIFEGRDHLTLIATTKSASQRGVVGMIEISLQPPIATRNPPPFPVPLKQLLFTGNTQGWITNLLVVPEYRGRGLGKILVAAAESVARDDWQCTSVHLHCEANDRLARRLYENLGFVSGKPQHLEGTQLVYMSKDLSD